ncbi:26s proteasome non-atpase regulatory subunit 1 [Anaeramoeba flamelloides]|uniref:26s proteasome non-atpase regulatory subunit 1 n=1 Tax=Anaeramoeba flamelloides TaxID=1746091 RepID=A0ABQ8XFH4_9EUKA|nr:26s proteasome non-atpase regulatory subunit 1 [Anaeramoeba flamelloides]
MSVVLSTASGIIALLDEPDNDLKTYALRKLDGLVDQFWAEISDSIGKIEALYEDEEFPSRTLAAIVASKVYYHLGFLDDSLLFALGAGQLFDVSQRDEFTRTLISKTFNDYIEKRNVITEEEHKLKLKKQEEEKNKKQTIFDDEDEEDSELENMLIDSDEDSEQDEGLYETKNEKITIEKTKVEEIDPRLEKIINSVFRRCFLEKEFKEALGIAIEARRIDIIKEIIEMVENTDEMLTYCLSISRKYIQSRWYRQEVLTMLLEVYESRPELDYINICDILLFLNDVERLSEILNELILEKTKESHLIACQIGFDLYENASQHFLHELALLLPDPIPVNKPVEKDGIVAEYSPMEQKRIEYIKKMDQLKSILSGRTTINLHLQFLNRNNKTDLQNLIRLKEKTDSRHSLLTSMIVMAHGLLNCGTTSDVFLRDNLGWLAKISNWAKFCSTASLGLIHKGHLDKGFDVLEPYLPQGSGGSSPYSEGGSLYALGLINTNHGEEVTPFLLEALKNCQRNNIIQHGACLGIGLSSMAVGDMQIYEELRGVLYNDDAVAGEAAGIAMGLLMLGTGNRKAIQEMWNYAHQTEHEKIIRGVSVGMSLIMYGKEQEAEGLIEQLSSDKDSLLRYGAMFTIAMAYAGTSNEKALRKLLHVAVSDVNDDVRRAAVIAIGFLLFKEPKQVPKTLSLLAKSYNNSVRFGAAMALGITCAGTANKDALELLGPLTKDLNNIVRQGALIATGMVLMQSNEKQEPKVSKIKEQFYEIVSDKYEHKMTKMGAILGAGLIDAGGRNVTISMQTTTGENDMAAIVGLAIFSQYWFWHPLTYFISLAFQPTALIGLNKDLNMPKFKVKSNAKPSVFAYPSPLVEVKKVEKKVETAVLSVTKKEQRRQEEKAEQKKLNEDNSQMDSEEVDEKKKKQDDKKIIEEESTEKEKEKEKEKEREKEKEKEKEKKEKEEEKEEKEPEEEILENPTRITLDQRKYITFDVDPRYKPVKESAKFGIVMLLDTKPDEEEELIEISFDTAEKEEKEKEPEPPEPFEYFSD